MPLNDQSAGTRGVVVAYVSDQQAHASEHERITQAEFARRLAALKDYEAGGLYDPRRHYSGHIYFVPGITLTGSQAAALGIRGPDDLFGGVVPHAFVATKVISHPLVEPGAAALPGWNPDFAAQAGDAVLAGYAAFNHDDARRAGLRLLESGPVRIKPVLATGGHGQSVARDAAELQRDLKAIDPGEVVSHGLVLEENLSEVRTFSVGQVKVGDLTASYFGHQRLTRNNRGAEVYGGSDLTVMRGDFDALLAQDVSPEIRPRSGRRGATTRPSLLATPASLRRATTTTSSSAGTRRGVRARVCWNNPGALAVPQAPKSLRSRSFEVSPVATWCARPPSRSSGRARRRRRMRPSISAATIRGPGD